MALALALASASHAADARRVPYDAQRDAYLKEAFQLTKVTASGSSYRIANFSVRHALGSKQAVFFIDGDIPEKDISAQTHRSVVDAVKELFTSFASNADVDYIYVARPGYFISSGERGRRGFEDHYRATGLAIKQIIKERGYESVALAGQSGGAMAALAITQLDLVRPKCVAAASGLYYYDMAGKLNQDRIDKLYDKYGDRAVNRYFDALYEVGSHIDDLRIDPDRKIYLIGDPKDEVVLFKGEQKFAQALSKRNHDVMIEASTARDANHHGLALEALLRATHCVMPTAAPPKPQAPPVEAKPAPCVLCEPAKAQISAKIGALTWPVGKVPTPATEREAGPAMQSSVPPAPAIPDTAAPAEADATTAK